MYFYWTWSIASFGKIMVIFLLLANVCLVIFSLVIFYLYKSCATLIQTHMNIFSAFSEHFPYEVDISSGFATIGPTVYCRLHTLIRMAQMLSFGNLLIYWYFVSAISWGKLIERQVIDFVYVEDAELSWWTYRFDPLFASAALITKSVLGQIDMKMKQD